MKLAAALVAVLLLTFAVAAVAGSAKADTAGTSWYDPPTVSSSVLKHKEDTEKAVIQKI
jgi:hypothetical protein